MTLSTDPWPVRLLPDSAALLERFARTIFRTKIDAATRNNYTGKALAKKTARPTQDLQLFPAQPGTLLNFKLGKSKYRTAGTVKQRQSQAPARQIFDIERFVK